MPRTLEVTIIGDASSLEKALGRAGQQTSKFGSGLKKASFAAAGALGVLGVAAKLGFDEIAEGQKVAAQTEAVLKSTGGAAGLTAKGFEDLAGSISAYTGIDDEAIQSAENLLATFVNVRDGTKKTDKVFTEATKTIADMSVALGQDMKSSAIQVGKALNDPIKGVTALQRVGVSFTAAQKEQIKALVESGKTMEAQKLILRELNTEFGGSAKAAGDTLPGQLAKTKLAFEETAGSLTAALLPSLEKGASLMQSLSAWMQEHATATKVAIGAIAGLAGAVLVANAAMKTYVAVQTLVKGATVAWTAAQWLLNVALTANPIGVVIVALGALVAGIVVAWKHSETFRRIVTGAFEAVKGAAEAVLGFFKTHWKTIAVLISGPFAPIVLLATDAFGVRSALIGAFNAIQDRVVGTLDAIGDGFRWLATSAPKLMKLMLAGITAPIEAAIALFQRLFDIVAAAKGVVQGILDSIANIKVPSINIPGFQHGVTNFGGGLAIVGEAGPELVNLPRGADVIPIAARMGGASAAAGGIGLVTVHVHGSVISERELTESVRRGLYNIARRNPGTGL